MSSMCVTVRPVGNSSLSEAGRRVACRSTQCGEPRGQEPVLLPAGAPLWMQHLRCNGNEENLWKCEFSQWSVNYQQHTTEKITCSSNITMWLEDFRCAGRVRFSDGKNQGHICKDKFDHQEVRLRGNRQNLCSGILEQKVSGSWSPIQNLDQNQNQTKERLKTWCQQMFCGDYHNHTQTHNNTHLTCSGRVSVLLTSKGKPSVCYGTVQVKQQEEQSPVCATQWKKTEL
ncbi:scavenger receptor cysteine-rich type 1 protein M130-like [Boleophthalmus pectinirostris]|uniref:scavenger receptor cysteine-rich type 1 protein M130-like n=1 Tax=Boleophthalmus pectinirostris TaxID=150288 RepID=UPI00242DB811|nr:scavenger receptor cysteine-rich type 1 protein M130-like [Boleophthalmus pectinirostris]